MSETCYNKLYVKAPSAKAEKQLEDFKAKSHTKEEVFDISGTYPCPKTLGEEIYNGNLHNIADYLLRKNEDCISSLEPILKYDWVKNLGINTAKDLEEYFRDKEIKYVDTTGITYDKLPPYDIKAATDWRESNWGTRWCANFNIINNSNRDFYVSFDSSYGPPNLWLKKISQDYPDLLFELGWDVWLDEGNIISMNGIIIEYVTDSEENISCNDSNK